jgi:hypothetical protein
VTRLDEALDAVETRRVARAHRHRHDGPRPRGDAPRRSSPCAPPGPSPPQGGVGPEAVRRPRAGWVADEALAIAVYCALVAERLRHGVRLAVNHSGDSDSTGAMTGSILATHARRGR